MRRQFTVEIARDGGETYGTITRYVTVTAYSRKQALEIAKTYASPTELVSGEFTIVAEKVV